MEGRECINPQALFHQKQYHHRYNFLESVSSSHIFTGKDALHVVRREILRPDSASTKASPPSGHVIIQTNRSFLRIPSCVRYVVDLDLLFDVNVWLLVSFEDDLRSYPTRQGLAMQFCPSRYHKLT
jgi:hypothetical protein